MVAAMQARIIRPALFVEANFISGPVYLWTGYGSIAWNGQTWLGAGNLGSVSIIEEVSTVEAKGITLVMNGIPLNLLTSVMTDFRVGLPAIVHFGLFDDTNTLIPDPITSFSGRMDQPTVSASGDSASIAINCESRLIDLNTSVERRYTNEDQQLDHPGDRGLEFVNAIQNITLYWGRTPGSHNNF